MLPEPIETRISSVFDSLIWRDPVSGAVLEPIVTARTPAGVPISGALKIAGSDIAYPIVDCVARLTPFLANRHQDWLLPLALRPPPLIGLAQAFQEEESVASFGFQWTWNSEMRSAKDLQWRVADRFRISATDFSSRLVLDAGAGAGDQSAWLIKQGALVVSVDLSSAIDVVAKKLRMNGSWFGVQGDITALPFSDEQFDYVYCEGVIQHTHNSETTVRELCRVVKREGRVLATHYDKPSSALGKIRLSWQLFLRKLAARLDRFKLLLVTGALSFLSYIPIVGALLRKSGTVIRYDLMTDFKTTWTNTFDAYGLHWYQRYITSGEFRNYFESVPNIKVLSCEENVLVALRE